MASPNFDSLSVRLSHVIDDPVAAAGTNGTIVTSALRTIFLNDGIRKLLVKWAFAQDWMALKSYLKDGNATLSAGAALLSAWTGNVFIILSAKNVTDNVLVHPLPPELKHYIDVGINSYDAGSASQQYYVIDAGYFRLLDGVGTSTDTIALKYVKQHSDLSVGAGASTVVSDTAWTASTVTITNFTGVLSTHVGGTFVGLDNGGNPFSRLITSYVSSTSFTIDSALVAGGAGTNGYIIPPSQNDIEIDSQYWDEVIQEAAIIYWQRNPTEKNTAKLAMARGGS